MKIILTVAICVVSLFGVNAMASEQALLEQISRNNKDIIHAQMNTEGEMLSARSENNLPDPELELEYMANPANSLEMVVSETVEWPGIYVSRRKELSYRMTAMEYLYEAKKVEVLRDARLAYVDLVNVNRQIQRSTQILELVKSILDKVEQDTVVTDYTVLDVMKLKVEAFDLASTVSELVIKKQALISNLELMNGGLPLENVDFDAGKYNARLQSLSYYEEAFGNSPEAKAEYQQALADRHAVKTSKQGWLPSLTLGYKFAREDGMKVHGFVFGISLPIFSNRNKARAAKAFQTASYFGWEKRQFEAAGEVRVLYGELLSLEQSLEKYRDVIADSEEAMAYLDTALNEKSITIIDYLSEYKYLLEAKSRLEDMEYDYNLKYVELSKYDLFQ